MVAEQNLIRECQTFRERHFITFSKSLFPAKMDLVTQIKGVQVEHEVRAVLSLFKETGNKDLFG